MAPGKYTVIVMRDDADVRRFKAGPTLLRLAAYVCAGLLLVAAGGAFGAWRLWKANASLAEDKRALELKLSGVNIKLERLQNIERILISNDPSELKSLLSTITPAAPEAQPKANPASAPADGKPGEQAAEATAEPDKAKSPFEGFPKVDTGACAVENITMRFDAKGLTLGFGLKNLNPQTTISGSVGLALVTSAGQVVDLATKEELGFQIQRFKQMAATAPFPASIERKDVAGLKLTINNASGKTIFSDIYTFSQN